MGFFDCRCMVTGVSLKGANATAVLLQKMARYHPIALPITGNYDRFGSIDGVDEDDNTQLILKFFLDKLAIGEFVIDEPYWSKDRYPISHIEDLLWGFERNTHDNQQTAVLNGKPVVFALICERVWSAIVGSETTKREPDSTRFDRVFKDVPVAEEIYRGNLEKVSDQLRELAAVSAFLNRLRIAWTPTKAGGQDFAEEIREYLTSARKQFRGSPAVLEGLDNYEREIADLFEE